MASDHRFTAGLAGWLALLIAATAALAAALITPDLAVVRILAAGAVVASAAGLLRHVTRINRMLASFLEAMRLGDWTARVPARGGAGFDAVGQAMNDALQALHHSRSGIESELRFLEALADDVPVALLIVEEGDQIRTFNKAARTLFDRHQGTRPDDFVPYGASFAALLTQPHAGVRELMLLMVGGRLQRALVRVAAVQRLGARMHVVTVEPLQGTLDAVEVAAQTDLVRVLTHEILNSLTPILSLSNSASELIAQPGPDLGDARAAITTLDRRARGLLRFVEAYRSVARAPVPRPIAFDAATFAGELARLFRADWPECRLTVSVDDMPAIVSDPDLLAQALINLLRNAGQATQAKGGEAEVTLSFLRQSGKLVIVVADNGPGIAESIKADIFLPFFTTKAEGTGVGLNMVRQIVVALEGTVDLTSSPEGTRFTILL